MTRLLERPVWSALATRHAALATGDRLAKRYPSDIVPFAAAVDEGAESLAALAGLVAPGESVFLLQADAIVLPTTLEAEAETEGVQMVADRPSESVADAMPEALGAGDAADMLQLAALTNPGPFTARALALGEFWGLRSGDRLVAMAGERMKQPGYSELSGVCVHPDFRGQGLARHLSLFVANRMAGRGDIPYLHAFATNIAAIRLYESIGFSVRRAMHVAVVRRST